MLKIMLITVAKLFGVGVALAGLIIIIIIGGVLVLGYLLLFSGTEIVRSAEDEETVENIGMIDKFPINFSIYLAKIT